MKFNFKRVDVHYMTIEADSVEDAQAIADTTSCFNDGVDNAQGEWEFIGGDDDTQNN